MDIYKARIRRRKGSDGEYFFWLDIYKLIRASGHLMWAKIPSRQFPLLPFYKKKKWAMEQASKADLTLLNRRRFKSVYIYEEGDL